MSQAGYGSVKVTVKRAVVSFIAVEHGTNISISNRVSKQVVSILIIGYFELDLNTIVANRG